MNPWQGDPVPRRDGDARGRFGKAAAGGRAGRHAGHGTRDLSDARDDVFTETDIVLEAIGAMLTPAPEPMPDDCCDETRPALPAPAADRTGKPAAAGGFRRRDGADDRVQLGGGRGRGGDPVGYPVVLKGVAEGVAHKSDLGLVHVGLRDPDAVARCLCGDLDCPNVVVQAMVAGRAGGDRRRYPRGRRGAGVARRAGRHLRRSAARCEPCGRCRSAARHRSTAWRRAAWAGCWPVRAGSIPDALRAFIDLLLACRAAALSLGDRLQAIDINPVILGAAGAVAVDALVVPGP